MNRIPKSAQRAIDRANRESAARITAKFEVVASLPIPRRLDSVRTPRSIINMHDVYFNGEKQTLCTLADVDQGYIIRWSSGRGNFAAPGAVLERHNGRVEIRRR